MTLPSQPPPTSDAQRIEGILREKFDALEPRHGLREEILRSVPHGPAPRRAFLPSFWKAPLGLWTGAAFSLALMILLVTGYAATSFISPRITPRAGNIAPISPTPAPSPDGGGENIYKQYTLPSPPGGRVGEGGKRNTSPSSSQTTEPTLQMQSIPPPPVSPSSWNASDVENIAREYLKITKQWNPDDYRIEPKGAERGTGLVILWAVYQGNEKSSSGSGNSLILSIDPERRTVMKEEGF